MTKTWYMVLAALLGLTATALHAAEPPEFLSLPPTEIKLAPLPLDTKAPLPGAYGPACAPAAIPTACSTAAACGTSCATSGPRLCQRLQERLSDLADRDRPCLNKLYDWLTYRPCQLTSPGCCYYMRPAPAGYEWFLHPGCSEGSCGGCCKAAGSCGGCGSCGR